MTRRIDDLPHAGGLLLCFGCHQLGACRLGISAFASDGPHRYVAELRCGVENTSGPNIAHGGWVASVLDEVVGLACVEELGLLAVTTRLDLRFRRPTPTERLLRIEATVRESSGNRVSAAGSLVLAETGEILATVTGEWAVRPGRRA